jgi:type IV pilus assembly protein PilX
MRLNTMKTHLIQIHRRPPNRSRGVVIVIALILMVVIGLGSTAAIRLAMTGSAIATGLKANNEAQQAADLALRWCELQVRQVLAGAAAPGLANFNMVAKGRLPDTAWQDFEVYAANARPVPQVVLNNAGMQVANSAPTCLVQESQALAGVPEDQNNLTGANSPNGPRMYSITVRGMSRDFVENTDAEDRGSEVWQQVTLVVRPR